MSQEMHRGRLFLGCIIALVATAFGFIIRSLILDDWRTQFNLSQGQIGYIQGAIGLPFAISIILFSLIVDKIGYGVSMVFAFCGHVLGAVLTIYAGTKDLSHETAFQLLYIGTFVSALANGIVEAVINPVTATIYADKKTHYLNILHAGWPGGLVLGGLLTLAFAFLAKGSKFLGLDQWQLKVALILLPTLAYGVLLMGQKFPVQERVAAGVSFRDMMREFGAGSCFIVTFLVIFGIYQVLNVFGVEAKDPLIPVYVSGGVAAAAAIAFAVAYRSLGRPMFIFLLFIMLLLATTEIGTDGWISDIMREVLKVEGSKFDYGALVLIYTSAIMFVLRFFAGPIVHRISPLGLLAASAGIACAGLLFISKAGSEVWMVFLAATLYGFGKTFFWPTTLGVVSEQFPKGGALMLNAIAGVGMIAVGVLGFPLMGTIQDKRIDAALAYDESAIHATIMKEENSLLGPVNKVDQDKLKKTLSPLDQDKANFVISDARQKFLGEVALLPGIMFVCYLILIGYFATRGGYKAKAISHEEEGPSEF